MAMKVLLKLMFACSLSGTCLIGMAAMGPDPWGMLGVVVSVVVVASTLLRQLDLAALLIARIVGVLACLALGLLLLAGTIGGSFHLAPSNQMIAVGLALVAFSGCALFAFRLPKP
ncbi:MAG: hypothetical protein KDJ14_04285 [Xanthomonadales bacterium]|nr:hypothetical protein [Xanthomonadales bacterium]